VSPRVAPPPETAGSVRDEQCRPPLLLVAQSSTLPGSLAWLGTAPEQGRVTTCGAVALPYQSRREPLAPRDSRCSPVPVASCRRRAAPRLLAPLVAEQKSRAALLLVVRMQASASARLAVVTHPAPGRCGSRVAARVRDVYQRSSDDKVPVPSTPLSANSRLAPAPPWCSPTTASRPRPRRAAPPRRDCSPSPPGWRSCHPRGAQLPRHGICPGPVGPRRGERVAR
jgi:hypothetical protein